MDEGIWKQGGGGGVGFRLQRKNAGRKNNQAKHQTKDCKKPWERKKKTCEPRDKVGEEKKGLLEFNMQGDSRNKNCSEKRFIQGAPAEVGKNS